MENEKIYVFDAYGTLFDVDHACKEMAIQLGDNWEKLSSMWRQKQLEYSWLYNSMNIPTVARKKNTIFFIYIEFIYH